MLERSSIGENALHALHDEDYAKPYDARNLTHNGLIFTSGRSGKSLNGDWNFCVDLLDTGLRQKWFAMQPATPEERTEPWDYDPYAGESVPVPSNWQMLKEKWYFYEGSAWYTRSLDHKACTDRRQVLRIGASNYETKVFLNGEFLGNHLGGSTPFCVELTDHLHDGRNWLMICVNNSRTHERVPMRNTDWFNYGGIYRDVTLYDLPKAFISDMFLRLSSDGLQIEIDVAVDGADSGLCVVTIPELDLSAQIALKGGKGHAVCAATPELWSPELPKLYAVSAEFREDRVSDRIGFRTITRQGTDILLNGKPIWLRGISVHEDDRELGKVATEDDLRRRFEHARALGCNYLRLAHYPHHERASELADEMGFLLWAEIPVYWAIAFDNPETYADAENQLLELIRRDRNRASVVIWSIGNENPDTDTRLTFMRNLAEAARRADPTRLIAAACLVNHTRKRIEDRLTEFLDVIGINEYYGWYDENIADLVKIGRNSQPDRPVVISETGADGAIGKNAPESGLFSTVYMTEVYRQQLKILRDLDYIKGMSPWILYDFRVERRQNIFQQGFNLKGLIAADKATRKPAFEVLASFYGARARGEL